MSFAKNWRNWVWLVERRFVNGVNKTFLLNGNEKELIYWWNERLFNNWWLVGYRPEASLPHQQQTSWKQFIPFGWFARSSFPLLKQWAAVDEVCLLIGEFNWMKEEIDWLGLVGRKPITNNSAIKKDLSFLWRRQQTIHSINHSFIQHNQIKNLKFSICFCFIQQFWWMEWK